MKKLSLVLIALLVASMAMAEVVVEPAASISGDATLTFGFNLDDQSAGFKNEMSSSTSITLVAKASDTKMGEGDLYGKITLSNFEVKSGSIVTGEDLAGDDIKTSLIGVTAPGVSASLVAGDIEVVIYNVDGFKTGAAAPVEGAGDTNIFSVETDDANIANVDLAEYGGFTVKYAGMVNVHVASETGYAAGDGNEGWLVGVDASIAAGPATIKPDFVYGIGGANDGMYGVGVGIDLAVDPATVALGVDYDGTDFEVSGSVSLAVDPATVGVKFSYSEANDADVLTTIGLTAGAATVDLTVGTYDLTSTLVYGVKAVVGYTIDEANSVSSTTVFESADVLTETLAFTNTSIPLTTLTFKWASGNLMAATPVLGTVTAACKVAY